MNGFNSDLPPPGLYDAQIFDIRDLGILPTSFGPTHKVAIRFRLQSGTRDFLIPRTYAYKITARSHLGRDITSLLGELPEPGFDLKSLVGLTCQLHLAIEQLSEGRNRARVLGIVPLMPRTPTQTNRASFGIRKRPAPTSTGIDFFKNGGAMF